MVYNDNGPRKILAVALVVIGLSFTAYYFAGEQIATWFNTQNLLSQVTPLAEEEIKYLQERDTSYDLSQISSFEEVSALFLEILERSGADRSASREALEKILYTELNMSEAAPGTIPALVTDAALRYQSGESTGLTQTSGTSDLSSIALSDAEQEYLATRSSDYSNELADLKTAGEVSELFIKFLDLKVGDAESTQQERESIINEAFSFDENIPATIRALVIDAAIRYPTLRASADIQTMTTTTEDSSQDDSQGDANSTDAFLNEVLSILANHGAAANKDSVVRRYLTTQALLDGLLDEL